MAPDLSYHWEGVREWSEDNKWDEGKTNVAKVCCYYQTQHPNPFPGFFYLYVSILLLIDYLFLVQ